MQFENRPPDEGINAQPEHLGREAIWLIVGAIVCVIGLVVLADVAASWLAPRLPFSLERELAERMEGEPPKLPPQEQAANAALQELADRLRGPLGMPEDITVKVRVDDSEVLNAYATVGGRIVIHRGLLRRLRGEHELAALLAHEMAHVQHRHVAASLGRGLAIGLVLSVVSADAGGRAAGVLLEQTGGLLMRGYGRDHEREADTGAMRAAAALHGHVGGVIGLFDLIASARDEPPRREAGETSGGAGGQRCSPSGGAGAETAPSAPSDSSGAPGKPPRAVPTWLSTHPADEDRSEAARAWARQNGVPVSGAAPAMHPALLAWARASQEPCQQAGRTELANPMDQP